MDKADAFDLMLEFVEEMAKDVYNDRQEEAQDILDRISGEVTSTTSKYSYKRDY